MTKKIVLDTDDDQSLYGGLEQEIEERNLLQERVLGEGQQLFEIESEVELSEQEEHVPIVVECQCCHRKTFL